MTKGKLIIIESGSDGSGKATQTKALYEKLVSEGYNVRQITFPNYQSPACMPVKMYLNGDFGKKPEDVNAFVASTFFAVDRFASFKQDWEEFYNNGGIVLSDRYTTSNMVHQAVKMNKADREIYLDWLTDLEFNKYGLPEPDAVIFLNVEPEVSQQLMEDRPNKFTGQEEKDIHENNKEYLINSYNNSLEIAEKYNWLKVNCIKDKKMRSIEDISEEIYSKVIKLI